MHSSILTFAFQDQCKRHVNHAVKNTEAAWKREMNSQIKDRDNYIKVILCPFSFVCLCAVQHINDLLFFCSVPQHLQDVAEHNWTLVAKLSSDVNFYKRDKEQAIDNKSLAHA